MMRLLIGCVLMRGGLSAAEPERPDARPPSAGSNLPTGMEHPLYIMNRDGTDLRPLVSIPEYTAHGSPAFTPDGKRIAFDAWRSGRGETYVNAHIFVADANGGNVRDLGPGAMPSWSPGGNRIVFSCYQPRGVWIMHADG
ncbi:MAG: hypothetical protein GXP27_18415, partial [Planctomycetes bacterium]|nr:hypothetical protein [Planctomycetota bacterium]